MELQYSKPILLNVIQLKEQFITPFLYTWCYNKKDYKVNE